jgi:hypothetical protein
MDWILYFTALALVVGFFQEASALHAIRQHQKAQQGLHAGSYQGDLSIDDIVCRTCCSRIALSGLLDPAQAQAQHEMEQCGVPVASLWTRIPRSYQT